MGLSRFARRSRRDVRSATRHRTGEGPRRLQFALIGRAVARSIASLVDEASGLPADPAAGRGLDIQGVDKRHLAFHAETLAKAARDVIAVVGPAHGRDGARQYLDLQAHGRSGRVLEQQILISDAAGRPLEGQLLQFESSYFGVRT